MGVVFLTNKVKWGILGAAEIALEQTIPAMKQAKNATPVAIASLSGKHHKVAKQFSIPKTYESYEALLQDPEIDAVYVPLPNHLHAEWVKKVATSGKHVLCEKPAALTKLETVEMIETCEENNVQFMEAYMYQFHPQHQRVIEMIESGILGNVKMIHSSFSFQLEKFDNNFRLEEKEGGGSIYDIGCYCIHLTRMLSKSEPENIKVLSTQLNNFDVDISAIVLMQLENDILATFNCSMNATERHCYEVVGSKGVIKVTKAFIPQQDGEGIITLKTSDGTTKTEKIYGDNYILGIEHFSDAILNDKKPIYHSEETIKNMRAIEQCIKEMKSVT